VLAQESIILYWVSMHTLALATHVDGIGGRVEFHQAVQLIIRIKV
jgi:hypothetical protein